MEFTVLLTIMIPLISGIIYLIRSQMLINRNIFIAIAELKRDVNSNASEIIENKELCNDRYDELMGRNQKEHEYIVSKIDALMEYIMNDTLNKK